MKKTLFVAALVTLSACVHAYSRQPNMEAALVNLQNAKASLVAAASNKGGHRVKAIQLIDAAMAEVSAGMAYAD